MKKTSGFDFDNLFESWGDLWLGLGSFDSSVAVSNSRRFKKTDKGYEAQFDVAGYKKDELSVEVKDNILVISMAKNSRFGWAEKSHSYYLDKDVKADEISSSLEDGILTVILPVKTDTPTARKIEIK